MIIPAKPQFNWLTGFYQEDFKNFDQSEHIIGPGSHWSCTKNVNRLLIGNSRWPP
jgi:hypothetical protein